MVEIICNLKHSKNGAIFHTPSISNSRYTVLRDNKINCSKEHEGIAGSYRTRTKKLPLRISTAGSDSSPCTLLCGAPQLFEPVWPATVVLVELVTNWIFSVVVLMVALGSMEILQWHDRCNNGSLEGLRFP